MLIFSAITPHPPIIVPGVANADDARLVSDTVKAMVRLGEELAAEKPDTIIVISPHAPMEETAFSFNVSPKLSGDFQAFGLNREFEYENDLELIEEIMNELRQAGDFSIVKHRNFLDHGTLVPLSFLTKDHKPKVVQIAQSWLAQDDHYRFGQAIRKAIDKSDKKIAFIASGDLSHRLIAEAPAGFSSSGKVFDEALIEYLGKEEIDPILGFEPDFIEDAGQCGLNSIVALLGLYKGKHFTFEMYSYEGPFGVGYLVGKIS